MFTSDIVAEVMNGIILQQAFVVEFVIQTQQCDACQKSYTEDPWKVTIVVPAAKVLVTCHDGRVPLCATVCCQTGF